MKKIPVIIRWFIVVILQVIASQVVTFAGSFMFPNSLEPGIDHPWTFAIMLGMAFSLGIFLVGWFALKRGWLEGQPRLMLRLAGTLIGAYLVLFAGIWLVGSLPAGSPFFGVAMLASLLGFHQASWFNK